MKKFAKICLAVLLAAAMLLAPATASATEFTDDLMQALAAKETSLNSAAMILINLDTDTTVASVNPDERMEPASVTKIIVALLLLENIHDIENTTLTARPEVLTQLNGTNSSLSGIRPDEVLTAEQMLYCLMVPSGNDAAMVIADNLGSGDINAFVEMMNRRAAEIGCTNTHYANPHGLHDPNHYTSVADVAKIIQYILASPYAGTFMDICTTNSYTLGPSNVRANNRTLSTTNYMQVSTNQKYYYKYTQGIKTGSTGEAGYCLATTAFDPQKNYRYLCVTMNAPMKSADGKKLDNGAMFDHRALYQWAFDTFEYKQLVSAKSAVTEIGLQYAWEQDKLLLVPATDFSDLVPKSIDAGSVLIVPNSDVPESVQAPVQEGQKLGTADVVYAGITLGTVDLVADQTVEASRLLLLEEQAKTFLKSKWLRIGAAVLAVLLVLYILISIVYNVRTRKKKRRAQNLSGKSRRKY